ncbi:protein FAM149A isoform X2 [Excalfactoria chinensis]|uniref:protein FAM149A isoform X2 n=1 Tax=Excalfactoria chinensis TaxID=46218 RepID=UPI003B3A4786
MKLAALELGSLLVCLRRSAAGPSPAAPSPRPPSGGGCTPAAGGRPSRPLPAVTEEAGSWAGGKALPITLPDIGEEAVAEGDAEETERSSLSPRKGLSRGSTKLYHSGKSGESLPAVFKRNVQEAINNYSCETLSSVSSSGHATPTGLNNSWSGIKSCTTGLSTERSSVYSWRDDEFDKANTQRVHQLFWDIDEMLFEGKVTSQTQSLQAECTDWVERSLHLRVLGKQLLPPKDEGFQHFESRSDSSVDTKCLPGLRERTSNIKELCISGSKLIPKVSPVQKSPSSGSIMTHGSESSSYSFLEEEIYDADGKIEEYLAFDIKELLNIGHKDASLITSGLLQMYAESTKQAEKLKAVTGKLPHLPAVRVTADVGSTLLSRGSEARSVSFGSHLASSQVHHFSSSFCSDLNGVMTIQAKPLQQRHFAAAVQKIQNEQDDKPHSISTSAPNSVHASLGRIADNHVLSSSRVLLASARKLPSHRRLPSLTSDQLSSKAPNKYNDEILRGTKLGAGLDRVSSGCARTARNKLPPINSEAVKQYPSVLRLQQSSHRGQYGHSRVSSAVPGSTEQRPLRERTVTDRFSRPNTTHTFRLCHATDAPQKRPVTPMDFSDHRGTSHRFLTGSQQYYRSFHRNPLTSRRRFQITS